jgi:hypothetical protein
MPVNGVGNSGQVRVEQARSEHRAEDARAEEKRRTREQEQTREARRPQISGQGENMDVTA